MILAGGILAAQGVMANTSVKQKLTEKVKTMFPDTEVTSVEPSQIKGLYEVLLGADVLYLTEDGQFALKGDLWDLGARRNLSEERRGESRIKAIKSVKKEDMIEFAPADTKHVVYVFTDVDCTYCRKFHTEVGTLNKAGVAVRYLAFPRAGVGTESFAKSVSVWCSKDRKAALTEAKSGKDIPAATCENPVKREFDLGQSMGVRGTPTLYLENGQELGGYVPAEQLIQYVTQAGKP
jgi:thiol:disulfide interchange protein DsbC